MSQEYSILKFLNIKEKNIDLSSISFNETTIKGILSKVICATLTYLPNKCQCCGAEGSRVIKYGFKSSRIVIPKISEYHAYLIVKKQRFLCKTCNKTFIATSSIVDKHCFISKSSKLGIVSYLKKSLSEKFIAESFNVSPNTVSRVIDNFYKEYTPNKYYLPPVLCFDEFKSVKATSGAMSFIFSNGITNKPIDIVEDRRLNKLKDYFSRYTCKARGSVKHIVIDMYSPYLSLIKSMFPNAKISIDRFHLAQLINRAFNKTRIQLMKKYHKKDHPFYNKLKKYWKLMLKDSNDLSYIREYYHHSFRRYISENEIIDHLLKKDSELENSYNIYQELLYSLKKRNFNYFNQSLDKNLKISSGFISTSLNTLKEYLPYISNSLNYEYSNGGLEGINNKIKVLKRTAYGYRSFVNFRNRILICANLMNEKWDPVA